jgi:hypothetical protein
MSTLSEAREDVATRMAGLSVPVSASVPENVAPPCAFVVSGEPYVEGNFAGMMFGESKLNLAVILTVDPRGNDLAADALDDLIVETVAFIEDEPDLFFDSVEQPAAVTLNGQRYLGCLVNFARIVRLRS